MAEFDSCSLALGMARNATHLLNFSSFKMLKNAPYHASVGKIVPILEQYPLL